MLSVAEAAEQAAGLALRVLRGASPESIPVEVVVGQTPMFDARALALSPDGRLLAVAGNANLLVVVDGNWEWPATGTLATTCTPGPWHIARMIQSFDALPVMVSAEGVPMTPSVGMTEP